MALDSLPQQSSFVNVLGKLRRLPLIPTAILVVLVFSVIFADLIAPHDPTKSKLQHRRESPAWYQDGSTKFILGADQHGRDLLSRVIHGARISLSVAFLSITAGMAFGTLFGMVSGYIGGWLDDLMMRIVEVFLSVPLIMPALVVTMIIGQGLGTMVVVLTLFSWHPFARQVRAETLQLKATDYVALAQVAGASRYRILFRHIFPGVLNTIIVIATLNVGYLILTESILSFLGAGIPPPTPTWGSMVSEGRNYLQSSWWITFFPGMAIFITVVAFNLFGDWLRDTLDPRLRQI